MSIDGDLPMFPNNVVLLVHTSMQTIDADLFVTNRPLRTSDPVECIGVFAQQWTPQADSMEMRGRITGSEPTISRYTIVIQGLVKHQDEIEGLKKHAVLAKMIRMMLYRDPTLAVSLRALSVDLLGSSEKPTRYGISTQRYRSNEVQGTWIYVTTTEFWVETETV